MLASCGANDITISDLTNEGKSLHFSDFDCDLCKCGDCGHSWREIYFNEDGTGTIRARDEKERSWCEQEFKYSYDKATKTITIKSVKPSGYSTITCHKFEGDYVYTDKGKQEKKIGLDGFFSIKYPEFGFYFPA